MTSDLSCHFQILKKNKCCLTWLCEEKKGKKLFFVQNFKNDVRVEEESEEEKVKKMGKRGENTVQYLRVMEKFAGI